MIKSAIKKILEIIFADFKIQQSFLNFFYRQYEASVFKNLVQAGYDRILLGPFKGIKFKATRTSKNFRSVHLLGLFETCLHEKVVELAAQHDKIINIGCGTGYYTNGLAYNLEGQGREISIRGYDLEETQIMAANDIKEHNNLKSVEHVCVELGHQYSDLKGKKALAIIDIEGGEYPLLKEQKEYFENSDMIVEIHPTDEFSMDEGAQYLQELFAVTHDASIVEETKLIDFSVHEKIKNCLGNISYLGMHILTCENRSFPMKWLVLERKK
ncbi:MAG: hypothetical protein MRY79_00050 [Alphaproteobacteria bacterium]|nr:hypothetical protein [Alphaproteobacteria bacterium]